MMMFLRSVVLGVVSLCALGAQAQNWALTSVNVEKYTQLAGAQVRFTPGMLYDDSRGFEIFDFAVQTYAANSSDLNISSQVLAAINGKYVMSLAAWESEKTNFGGQTGAFTRSDSTYSIRNQQYVIIKVNGDDGSSGGSVGPINPVDPTNPVDPNNPDNPIGPTDPNYPPATGGTSVQLGLTLKGTSYCQAYAKPVKVSGSSAPQLTLHLDRDGASLRSGYQTIELTVEQVQRSAKVIDFIAYSNRERGLISLQGTLNVDKQGRIKTGKAVMLQSQVISSCFENYQVKLKAQ